MRVFLVLVLVIAVLGGLAAGQWRRNRQLAEVLGAFALLFLVLLVAAFFRLY